MNFLVPLFRWCCRRMPLFSVNATTVGGPSSEVCDVLVNTFFGVHIWPSRIGMFSDEAIFWRMADQDADSVPNPIVLIDQDSDANATVVEVSFGDRLGALVDTVS